MPAPNQTTLPAPATNVQTAAPADLGRLINEAPAKTTRGFHQYRLPDSVRESMHWKGTDADLVFGIWEPNAGEIRKLTKAETDWSDGAKSYIAALGAEDQSPVEGLSVEIRGTYYRAFPGIDNTKHVLPWWSRLSPKAVTLVTSIFVEMIMPTVEEGESLRASRAWVGG